MANIHPAGTTVAFWKWAKKLNELIFWARESDAETTTRDGWRDAMKRDIDEGGTLARDDSPDDSPATKSPAHKVSRCNWCEC